LITTREERRSKTAATGIVRAALDGTGVDLVGSCPVADYDAAAPPSYRAAAMVPWPARGLVVAGSAGPALWRAFRERTLAEPSWWDRPHPYDAFVASLLERADAALTQARVRFRRFEAAFHAPVRVDFLALARLAGLGSPSPFRLYVHDVHGPWWALRGAWLVDADVDPPLSHLSRRAPCVGCPAPCVGGVDRPGDIARATPEVRGRCVVGQASRYDDDQIAYHYDRENTRARLSGERR
jgi:hypothetical protein